MAKSCGRVTVPSSIKASREQRLAQQLPAVFSAGCHLSPVAGLTGESWKIEAPGQTLLARMQSADKAALGVNRRREQALLRHVAALNIAPQTRLISPPWLVVTWLSGQPCESDFFSHLHNLDRLSQRVVELQRLPPSGYRLQLHQQFSRYWQQIDRSRLTADWLRLHQCFMHKPMPQPLKLAVMHMDIHPGNLVDGEQGLRLIDWEYAADGDIALELAALFRGNGWSLEQQQYFLQAYAAAGGYGGHKQTRRLQQQIRRWTPWVEYLMLMWFEVRWQQTGDRQFTDWAQPLRESLFTSAMPGRKHNK